VDLTFSRLLLCVWFARSAAKSAVKAGRLVLIRRLTKRCAVFITVEELEMPGDSTEMPTPAESFRILGLTSSPGLLPSWCSSCRISSGMPSSALLKAVCLG